MIPIISNTILLPSFTTLIGLGGLTVGIFSFVDPIAATRIYGIPVHTTSSSGVLTSVLQPPSSASHAKQYLDSPSIASASDKLPLIHALGIRNLTIGLGIITLSGYWQYALAEASFEVRLSAQRMIGLVILVGSIVPYVDAWVCFSAAAQAEKQRLGERRDADENADTVQTARRAGQLHAIRGFVWLAGAAWCLFGSGMAVKIRKDQIANRHLCAGPAFPSRVFE